MCIETEWPATAKSQLMAPSLETQAAFPGRLRIVLPLLAAIVLLVYRISPICAGLTILAMILVTSVRRLARKQSAESEQRTQDLRSALETAEASGRQKDTFLAWASREIRGPMTAILGCCDGVHETTGPEVEESRRMIARNARQILSVVDRMAGLAAPAVIEGSSIKADQELKQLAGCVLVAEDGDDNRKVIEFYLEKAGVKFVTVSDGKSAYEHAMAAAKRNEHFDLILMDVQMPVSDGCEATILLRDHKYRAPIVALTANATERDRQRCLAAGYNGFLTKPIDVKKLAEVLSRYLRPAGQAGHSAIISESQTAVDIAATLAAADPRFAALKESFLEEIDTRVSAIEKALECDDIAKAAEISHQLKGTAGCYGLSEVSVAAGTLQLVAENTKDRGELAGPFTLLKELCRVANSAKAA